MENRFAIASRFSIPQSRGGIVENLSSAAIALMLLHRKAVRIIAQYSLLGQASVPICRTHKTIIAMAFMRTGASTPKVPNGTYKFLGVEAEEKEGKKYPSISFSLEGLEGENKGKKYLLPLGFSARKWSVRKNNREFEWIPDNSWVSLIRETPETSEFTARWGGKLTLTIRGEFYGSIIKSDGTVFGGTLYSVTPKLIQKRAVKKQLPIQSPSSICWHSLPAFRGWGF